MELYPQFSDEQFREGFSPTVDYIGLESFGNRVANLFKNLEAGSSVVLDGKWGTGKTHFAKALNGHLHKQNIPSIYFNAFEHDHMSVPFEAICSAITKAVDEAHPTDKKSRDKFLKIAGKMGKGVAFTAGRIGLRLATSGALDLTDLGLVEGNADQIADTIDDAVEKSVQASILSGAVAERTLAEFRTELATLRENLSKDLDHPLVVIIDELDRCRPDFSIGILEAIKHFFGIPKVHFLLVTNLDQMEAYANHLYGTASKSKEYLSKFYDIPIPFPPKVMRHNLTSSSVIVSHYFDEMLPNYFDGNLRRDAIDEIQLFANLFALSLRQTLKVCASTYIALSTLSNGHNGLGYLIAPLCVMKHCRPEIYLKVLNSSINSTEIDEFFGSLNSEVNSGLVNVRHILRYHTVDETAAQSEQYSNFGSTMARLNLGRTAVLPYVAHSIIESFDFPDHD